MDWDEFCETQDPTNPKSYYALPPNEALKVTKKLICDPPLETGGVCCATPYPNPQDFFSQELWSAADSKIPDVEIGGVVYNRADLIGFWNNPDNVLCEYAYVPVNPRSRDYLTSINMGFKGLMARRPNAELFYRKINGGWFHWAVHYKVRRGDTSIPLLPGTQQIRLGNTEENHFMGSSFGDPMAVSFTTELPLAEFTVARNDYLRLGPAPEEDCDEALRDLILQRRNIDLINTYLETHNCLLFLENFWVELTAAHPYILQFLLTLQEARADLPIVSERLVLDCLYRDLTDLGALLDLMKFINVVDIILHEMITPRGQRENFKHLIKDMLEDDASLERLVKIVNNAHVIAELYDNYGLLSKDQLRRIIKHACTHDQPELVEFGYQRQVYFTDEDFATLPTIFNAEFLSSFYPLALQTSGQTPSLQILGIFLSNTLDVNLNYPAFMTPFFTWVKEFMPHHFQNLLSDRFNAHYRMEYVSEENMPFIREQEFLRTIVENDGALTPPGTPPPSPPFVVENDGAATPPGTPPPSSPENAEAVTPPGTPPPGSPLGTPPPAGPGPMRRRRRPRRNSTRGPQAGSPAATTRRRTPRPPPPS